MHKLISSRNTSKDDAISKIHHHQHHQHLKTQFTMPLSTQTSNQQTKQQQQQQQQAQQQQPSRDKQQNQRHSNATTTKTKEISSYERFLGSNTIKSISDIQPSKVKMSGYLKKKRTKVGGWRKMWFVLQNQLLLSYSSKENYDKKLVSFKDVLNLVPGTTIHPLEGFRFAIETTTNVMYNFRCDDSPSYNQWLNALVESLSLNLPEKKQYSSKFTSSTDLTPVKPHPKFKNSISLDNIQHRITPPHTKIPIKSCNSSDSISRFNLSRMPNIPIAEATAKILQRNGIPSSSTAATSGPPSNTGSIDVFSRYSGRRESNEQHQLNAMSATISTQSSNSNRSTGTSNDNNNNDVRSSRQPHHGQSETNLEKQQQERARNFRLHEKRLSSGMLQQNLHQCDEVSRINRMFSRSRSRSANNVTATSIQTQTESETTTAAAAESLHPFDRNLFVTATATTTATTSSPYSSIVNIVANTKTSKYNHQHQQPSYRKQLHQQQQQQHQYQHHPIIQVKPTASKSASVTSVGIASIISLKEGYGRYNEINNSNGKQRRNSSHSSDKHSSHNSDNVVNLKSSNGRNRGHNNNEYLDNDRNFEECNGLQYLMSDLNLKSNNGNALNRKSHHSDNSLNCNYNRNGGGGGLSKYRSKILTDSDQRHSNQFFLVTQVGTDDATNEMTASRDSHLYEDILNGDFGCEDAQNKSDSQGKNILRGNSGNTSSPTKHISDNSYSSVNRVNKNGTSAVEYAELRDLNQNRMFDHSVDYHKLDFQHDKDASDEYECYPLQQKMQDLNICKHQQQQQQSPTKSNESADTTKPDGRIGIATRQQQNQSHGTSGEMHASPQKKILSSERTTSGFAIGSNPFYSETEFSSSQLGTPSSPHQSLQHFSHINSSPIKDEFTMSGSSTTTNSRCNSSLVTTESINSMTNSPTNDDASSVRKHQQMQSTDGRKLRILDSRIHPALQPSESMEDDLHMMNLLVHNDGDGESTTEDLLESILLNDHQRPASAQCLSSTQSAEPIYALVDLKNKHARRARLRALQDQLALLSEARDRDRPRSLQCISSDYEEVLNFECLHDEDDAEAEDDDDEDDDENENIYEPINIPEYAHHRQQQSHRHALWKYLRRINIEKLLELARKRKLCSPRHSNMSKFDTTTLHPTMSLPPEAYSTHQDQQTSPFSDIRRKLGNHRKSIKLRMKRFYNRHDLRNAQQIHANAIIKERNAFSDDELDSQGATGSTGSGASENSLKSTDGTTTGSEGKRGFVFGEIDKYRRGQKQFFGSLSRMKKTRTSLSLEEEDVKNFAQNNGSSSCNSSNNSSSKPWLVSPKMNRSEEKISNKTSKKVA